MKEPKTREEWQEVTDMCHFYLLLDSARQYGLVDGGPQINVKRCEQLFSKATRLGFSPSPGSVERLTAELL